MPWYFPWSDSIKKRACRYLLQHYLGHFLKEKLTLDQLSVDLYNGTGIIQDVLLDVWSLNEALDNYNIPVEIVDGFIGSIAVTIPWSALVNDSTTMEVRNLELTIQPKQRTETTAGVMLDSMFGSMTTSLQLAQECLKQEPSEGEQYADSAQPFEGLEKFAQTIEAVLTKVKVTFIDTIIRLEHLPREAKTGAALEIRINRIEYFDDQVVLDPGTPVDKPGQGNKSTFEPAAVAHKNFHLMGVSMYCDEFPECHRTFSRHSASSSPQSPKMSDPGTSPSLSPPCRSPPRRMSPEGLHGPGESPLGSKESDPIKIAVLMGRQELKLKIKQSDELPGPKLELDCHLGGLNLHLSPRQVHLLLEIAQGLAMPGLCDDSNIGPRVTGSKPMQAGDYERVEHELQRQLQHGRLEQHQQKVQMWRDLDEAMTTQSLEDSDEEDQYFDLGRSQSGLSSMESSFSSTTTKTSATSASTFMTYGGGYSKRDSPFQASIPKSARAKHKLPKQKDTLHKFLDDPTAEVTRYKLKLSFFSIIVLHEDPPATPSDGIDPGQTSLEKLQVMSDKFFGRAASINMMGTSTELVNLRKHFTEACPHDHLGCLGKPLTVECNQKSSSAVYSMHAELSIGMAEVVECVFDKRGKTVGFLGLKLPLNNFLPDYCVLLTFPQDEDAKPASMFSSMQASSPCVRIKIQHAERTHQSSRRSYVQPKTDVHVELAKCQTELDITMVDRIQALLNPQPLAPNGGLGGNQYKSNNPSAPQSRQAYFSQAIDEGTTASDRKLDLRISSPFILVTVRFPIPDLRTGQGIDKLPWWRRSLRKEVLILELTEANFHTISCDAMPIAKYEFTCRDAHGLFQESPDQEPLSFIRVSTDDSGTMHEREEGFDWPRIVVKMFPERNSMLEEEGVEEEDPMPDSLNGACQFTQPENSPFSSRKVMFENEEMVMPGDRAEMTEFQEKSVSNTRMHIELSLPNVNGILPSKSFFELLYNRINNDLLLWEPLAPAPLDTGDSYSLGMGQGASWGLDLATQLMQQQQQLQAQGLTDSQQPDKFVMCKSGVQYDSSSDSESECSGQFYSIHEARMRQRRKQQQEQRNLQSKMCLTLNITKGKVMLSSPLKDEDGKVNTAQHGEFQLQIEDGNVFCVVNQNTNPELRYVCVQAHRATLYHEGIVDIPQSWPVMERATLVQPAHLRPTIYLSEPGVATKLSGQVGVGGESHHMLALAMRIKMDTFNNIKEFQVALGLRGGTLQHRMTTSGHSWFSQILEIFDVVDYPILGYTMPKVVTELHTHLWSCAVDYRPIGLPLRSMLTAETFSVSSNIITDSPTSLLRFIVDDAALYLSDKCTVNTVDLKSNYVCVMDLGLFELSLRSSDGKDAKYPKLDLRASNNILHIRTCSDSFRALGDLIVYLADDGDLKVQGNDSNISHSSSDAKSQGSHEPEVVLSDSPQMTQSHMEQVHDLMADAMMESNSSVPQSSDDDCLSPGVAGPQEGTEMFFFPDEDQIKKLSASPSATPPTPARHRPAPPATSPGGDSCSSSTVSDDMERCSADEEFCIIDDPGLGIVPRDGEPTVRILSKEPISVLDNHFQLPLGKSDQLKAPEHFPPAAYRYTLREMSLVWYMYGGNDFNSTPKSKTGAICRGAQTKGLSSKADNWERLGKVGWQARGGCNRKVDVLMELQLSKVRMQYESFPENTEQASRQIILINEVEIRDRLASSKINKFLYQYTSDTLPKQSHANMLVVKALHVRPDPSLPAEECSLKVAILPLRLNIDQDSLFFLRTYFTEISESEDKDVRVSASSHSTPAKSSTPAPAPVMTVGRPSSPDAQELLIMFDEFTEGAEEDEGEEQEEEGVAVKSQPIFFKSFVFCPDVPIRLDYHGKHVDMEQGTLAGLLVGLAQLNCSELRLKRLNHRHGLLGFDRLLLFCLHEWLQDIKKNQVPSILGGVGPMYSLVQLVQGIRDLFWLPVEQYQRDGRIVRGIQRGAHSFTTSTAMATLELTNRLVQTVQYCAEVAYDMVSPGPSVRHQKHYQRQRRAAQPADIREGVSNAYNVVKEGLTGTATQIAKVAVEEHEQKGVTGAVGGVLRQIPPTILQPVILATEATSNVLGGMRNQLRPDKKREDEDKWKPEDS